MYGVAWCRENWEEDRSQKEEEINKTQYISANSAILKSYEQTELIK